MRRLITFAIVLGLLFSSTVLLAGSSAAQETPITAYLPDVLPLDHASCFRVDGDGILDFPALVDRFAAVPGAASQLDALGWEAGAFRQFGCDVPPAGTAGWIELYVHRFRDASAAVEAVPLFADTRSLDTGHLAAPRPDFGSNAISLSGPASNGTEYTMYFGEGPLLFQVTGVAPVGVPQADVEHVMMGLVAGADAAELHHARSLEVSQPAATFPPSYPTSTDPAYVILDLGTGRGNSSLARSINTRGEVLWVWGTTRDPMSGLYSDPHIVISWNGRTTDLTSSGMQFALAINDLGMVLGSIRDRGVLYWPDSGTVEPLPGFDEDAYPSAINDLGVVTGNANGQPVIADGARQIEIPLPPGYGFLEPAAINDAGDVAGTVQASRTSDTGQRAVLFADGVFTILGPAPGAEDSTADDLNDQGLLIGSPGVGGMHRVHHSGNAFIYDQNSGTMTDIGTLPGYRHSVGTAINNAGQMVGYAWVPENEDDLVRRPFLYDYRTGSLTDLNALIPEGSGWELVDVFDISDGGQIVGQGLINGEMHAYVLTPSR